MSVISGQVLLFYLSAVWWPVAGGPQWKAGVAAWGWSCVCHSFSRCFKTMCCEGDELSMWSTDTDHQQWCLWLRSSSSAEIYMVQMNPVKPVFHLLWLPAWLDLDQTLTLWREEKMPDSSGERLWCPAGGGCSHEYYSLQLCGLWEYWIFSCLHPKQQRWLPRHFWCCKHVAFIVFNFLCQCNSVCSSMKPL